MCRPWRSVWRSLATVRSARLARQAASARRISSSRSASREQLESDQVDRGRPVADQADHLGRAPAVHDQGFGVGADLARLRLGLEIGDGHRQEDDVDRLRLERPASRSRHSRRRCRSRAEPGAGDRAGSATARGASPAGRSSAAGRPRRGRTGRTLERELGGRRVDVPDRGPAVQARFGDRRGEPARGDVGQEPDVVDRRDRASPVTTTFIAATCSFAGSCDRSRRTGRLSLATIAELARFSARGAVSTLPRPDFTRDDRS